MKVLKMKFKKEKYLLYFIAFLYPDVISGLSGIWSDIMDNKKENVGKSECAADMSCRGKPLVNSWKP